MGKTVQENNAKPYKLENSQGNIIFIYGKSYQSLHLSNFVIQEEYGKNSEDYTKGFVGKIVEYLIDEFNKQGYHLLVKVIFRTTEVPRKIL